MQFLLVARDGSDEKARERRAAARAAHIRLGDEMRDRGELLYAVATLDDGGAMIGSVLILDVRSREALDEWLAQEPYVTGKVWERIDVQPCRVGPSFSKRA